MRATQARFLSLNMSFSPCEMHTLVNALPSVSATSVMSKRSSPWGQSRTMGGSGISVYAWRDVITATEIPLPPIVLLCPHGEERVDMTEVADTLGKAFTNVCISQGEKDIFNDKNRAWVARICGELAGNLTEMGRKQNPLRLTLNALYELIEKTLVDNNAYMVAKSLLLNRSRKLSVSRESAAQSTIRVIRRNGQIVPWSDHKVEIAVRKTFLSLARDSAPAVGISKAVSDRIHSSKQSFVHIEEIQDMVQEELMKAGHFKIAEAYILFRAERANSRIHGITPAPFDFNDTATT